MLNLLSLLCNVVKFAVLDYYIYGSLNLLYFSLLERTFVRLKQKKPSTKPWPLHSASDVSICRGRFRVEITHVFALFFATGAQPTRRAESCEGGIASGLLSRRRLAGKPCSGNVTEVIRSVVVFIQFTPGMRAVWLARGVSYFELCGR